MNGQRLSLTLHNTLYHLTMYCQITKCRACCTLDFLIRTVEEEKDRFEGIAVDFSDIGWNIVSTQVLQHCFLRKLSFLPLSVISANVRLALRCRSRLSEYTSVLSACKGGPEKKSTSALYGIVSYDAMLLDECHYERSRGIRAARRLLLARFQPAHCRRVRHWIVLIELSVGW